MGVKRGVRLQSSGTAILLNRYVSYATHKFYKNNKVVGAKSNYEIQWANVKNDIKLLFSNPLEIAPHIFYSLLAFFFIFLGKHEEAMLTAFVIGGISLGTYAGTVSTSITMSTLITTTKTIGMPGSHQGTISNVILDGVNMAYVIRGATVFNETAEIWYYDYPGALTNVSLAGTYSGGSGRTIGYVNLEGTTAGAPEVSASAVGDTSPATVSIEPLTNNSIIISSVYSEATLTVGAGETEVFIVQGEGYENAGSSYDIQTTAAAQDMDFTLSSGQRWAICAVAIAPVATTSNTYIATDSWTAPAGVTAVEVQSWAGGGGGAGEDGIDGSGGGGGGAYSKTNAITVVPSTAYTVTVGVGGAGGAADTEGSNGGDSGFNDNSENLAKGGTGGQLDESTAAGGAAASGVGDTKYSGGTGAAGGSDNGGGGGGGAGSGGNGGNGTTGNGGSAAGGAGGSLWGGAGGAGSADVDSGGSPGSICGGGGGGAGEDGLENTTGVGARGKVVLTYTAAAVTGIVSDRLLSGHGQSTRV